MKVEPYLFFNGCCEEALDFYVRALGAEITFLMRMKESPEPMELPPGAEDKVMHANLRIGESMLMASDGMGTEKGVFTGFSLAVSAPTTEQAEAWFAALGEGGKVDMPMQKTFWAQSFGMLTDRFGVSWMLSCE